MRRFDDKVVLITGGAGGIGVATMQAFLREGAQVAVADKTASSDIDVKAELFNHNEIQDFLQPKGAVESTNFFSLSLFSLNWQNLFRNFVKGRRKLVPCPILNLQKSAP